MKEKGAATYGGVNVSYPGQFLREAGSLNLGP